MNSTGKTASNAEDSAKIMKEAEAHAKTPEDLKALKLAKQLLKMTEKESREIIGK
ncbi:hypothetical protein IVG45_03270 [Methylomonas sp. LL1]|uniref:hypothetical protein n=1 Tax=Methylomonas sp. LL1 TaxID=2785785 RepID=UPI0018C39A4B|nr:hypothetical protein [Methylomonas sp. LL1]QPK64012.1 hypothetical protein IVG45_03270 [Methylomonas sp. LL1]